MHDRLWRWSKPLQVRLADKSTVISSKITDLPIQFAPDSKPVMIAFRVVPRLNHGVILGMTWFSRFNPSIDWSKRRVMLDIDACTR